MKETVFNLKRVYQYGKEYKKCLILQGISSIVGIMINVLLPILVAQLIVSLTESNYTRIIYAALWIIIVKVIDEVKTVVIRKNTQIYRRNTIKNIQLELISNILDME